MTNKVILNFTEEKRTRLEKINFFKYKEKIEITYICDIYGEYGYARQENRKIQELLKDLAWRIMDNDAQVYEVVIVQTPKMDKLFHEVIQSFISWGIKYRIIEEREPKNVMPVLSGPKKRNKE